MIKARSLAIPPINQTITLESMMDDLKRLLARIQQPFAFRSIARELAELMLDSKTPGEIALDASLFSTEWQIPESEIWAVVDRLEAEGFWETKQSINGAVLFCPLVTSAAKAINRKKKTGAMKRIAELSTKDRASSLILSEVGPSSVSEVTESIPKERRKAALDGGYAGWLPAANFGVSGLVFKPDAGLLSKLSDEHPEACMETALAMMFDDLKRSKDRPTMQRFGFWMRRWLEENKSRAVVPKSEVEMSELIALKMDEY